MHENASCANQPRRAVMRAAGAMALAAPAAGLLSLTGGCSMRDKHPQFSYTLMDGSQHSHQGLLGRVTLVNFWATTCAICVADMPHWIELHQTLKAGGNFEMLAVAMSYDPPARVSHYAESRRLPFAVAIDNTGSVARAFGDVRATPSLFLLDRQGRIRQTYLGRVDVAAVRGDIGALLGKA
jgi:peroxiredoxin